MPRLALIVPLRESDALAWVNGHIEDEDIPSRIALTRPEAVYAANLPGIHAWRTGLVTVWFWFGLGARFVVTRTGQSCLLDHYGRLGGRRVWSGPTEAPGQYRILLDGDTIAAHLSRLGLPCHEQPGRNPND